MGAVRRRRPRGTRAGRRRGAAATTPDTTAGRVLRPTASRGTGLEPEALRAGVGERAQLGDRVAERLRPGGRDPVGAPAVLGLERLDQPLLLEPRDRAVERAGPERHAREPLDVLGERVP